MKKLFVFAFLTFLLLPNITLAGCYDDFDWKWKKTSLDNVEIEVTNNTKNKIILTKFRLKTNSGDLMKEYTLNKTLEPYGKFEKYFFPKLNEAYLKKASLSCRYHESVIKEKRRKDEKKRAEEARKRAEEDRKKAEEVRKKNEENRKKAEEVRKKNEESRRKAEEEMKRKTKKINEETYKKNKTYKVELDFTRTSKLLTTKGTFSINILNKKIGVFKEEKLVAEDIVFGKFIYQGNNLAAVGKFFGDGFLNGGIKYPIEYLLCTRKKLAFVEFMNGNYQKMDFSYLYLNKSCDPSKLQLADYEHYLEEKRNEEILRNIIFAVILILVVLLIIYINISNRKKAIFEYNKTHKNKIKTYAELKKIREKEEKKEESRRILKEKAEIKKREKEEQEEEKKRLQEEKRLVKEERKIDKEVSSSDLGASLKRLKKMYNEGHLSKPEFEKAKNKLLK